MLLLHQGLLRLGPRVLALGSRLLALALNGAIADIEAVLHQVPVNRMHQCIGLVLRGADAVAQSYRAQHATARRDDLAVLGTGAGVEYLSRQPGGILEPADRIACSERIGIASCSHHDTERPARRPPNAAPR